MKISTFFLVLVAFFAFNTTILAQTCEPGLEQIPPISDSDWSNPGAPTWNTLGDQELANMLTFDKTGNWTGIGFVKGSSQTGSVKACGRDANHQLVAESDALSLSSSGILAVDTVQVFFNGSVFVTAGETGSVGIKFAGVGNRNVRNFDNATGTRLHVQNFFNDPFITDISNVPTEDGLYAIWAIVEDCVVPAPTGCTNNAACNFDPLAVDDDGSCSYPTPFYDCGGSCLNDTDGDGVCDELEVLGCTSDTACNFDPLATEEDLSCDWSCLTPCQRCDNGDGVINSTDLTGMLDVYGTPAEPGMDQRDTNSDGQHNSADLINLLSCFGQIVE